ncbi:cytochrome c biogenesis protein CcdA [Microbacterium sp. EYE_5]|uniref:cytochrome c biogenesis CcdA family protein n=1 Tax=unclassified Microbacterium TaxID=2609290 RepID=UPI002005A982|nr:MULTISPECIES: cytochrome c biogenesis protein CcdA [unclassified Microbacterium]MCK6080145.1 cytochrome c biogenesis protein CcdA [Microbacterium sp. EYE_382]MCK6085416.1 cytochrome c biogenesis protein CcdA [Microbacterium sp. EYE_384]MCK6122359.1 cytochrome c biogenesis protein CcdA [Microbacterium sp. EYE_80]MCK6126179.1 cytochrome c biogenesis protein CcdA [Microbacterium sp. EYE_79]MCK6141100.1 cytochrome c biogenesis protein CcdA [Microbacterium sp. EYE_39]
MNPGSIVFDGALWLAIPIAALAGLVSFLSPCVLPLVPGYLGFLGGAVTPQAERRGAASRAEGAVATATKPRVAAPGRGRLLGGVLLFIAGFTVVFVSMGLFAGTLGRVFLEYQELITRVLGVVVIVLGLVFLGVFGFAQKIYRPQLRQNLGLVGAPLLGLAMGIGWAPCIGPTLAAILSMAYSQADPGRAGLLAVAYSLGLGLPFILLALGANWATRSVAFVRRHIRVVNIVGGLLLVVLGVLMVSGAWTALMSAFQGVVAGVPTFL